MIFVFGGIYQGKLKYARNRFPNYKLVEAKDIANYQDQMIVYGFEELVGENIANPSFKKEYLNLLRTYKDLILVGNEIGLGVVPIKKEHRLLRDEIGFLYQEFASISDEVIRVWNGLEKRVK